MNLRHTLLVLSTSCRIPALCVALLASNACSANLDLVEYARVQREKRHPDPESEWNRGGFWKRVGDEPATYIPTDYPESASRTDGEWFEDSRDGKRFFAPKGGVEGVSEIIVRREAIKQSNPPAREPITTTTGIMNMGSPY